MAGTPSTSGCTNCAAYFHYEDGSKDGYWVLGLLGGCNDIRSASSPYAPPSPTPVTYFAFPFSPLNPTAQYIWTSFNESPFPHSLESLAQQLYLAAQTKLSDLSGPADDYQVVCADVPAPGAGCPAGSYWDTVTETCQPLTGVIRTVIVVPPPTTSPETTPTPPPYVIPTPIAGDGEGDELEQCCQQTALYLFEIATALQQLAAAGSDTTSTSCCIQVVQQLTVIALQMKSLVTILSAPPPPPPAALDLTAIVAELTCVCAQLTSISSSSSTVAADLAPGLKSIADAITNAPPTDLKALVDVLEKLYKTIDVPLGVYQDLADRGLISPELLQAIGAGEFGSGVVSVIVDFVRTALTWLLDRIGVHWTGSSFSLAAFGNTVADLLDKSVSDALSAGAAPLFPVIKGLVDAVVGVLLPTIVPEIGQIGVNEDLLISKTLAPALIINSVTLLADYLGWDVGETLRTYVDFAAEFIGLQEVRELKVGELMKYGPMRVAEMNAKRVYRQELPGASELASLSVRGLIPPDRYGQIAGLTGLPTELEKPTLEAAASGLNARMMLRLTSTGLFSDADVADELTFAGMRKPSQHRLVLAAAYLGTEPERGKLRSALEAFYRAGMVSDNDFVSRLESAEHNTDRTDLLLSAVQLEKQIALAHEYEGAYSREFIAGLLDPPGYQSALEALGMQPPDVAARMFRDETHINVTTSIQAARQARAQQRAEAAAERKAAIEAYRTGSLNPATLAAALLATGLTPTQVAASVAYQTLAAAGVLRWIYGLRLPPSQATLLRQQVADLTRQREISLLTDAQYVAALTALAIPPRYINALQAGANAHISPKTAAILTPVATG